MTSKDEEKAPGTLSSQDVADEFRAFKDKLLGVPGTLSDMAKKATGGERAESAQQATAAQPNELSARLTAIETRLESLETMLAEVRDHLIKER